MSEEKIQDKRLLDIGDTFTKNGNEFEVVSVSAQELDGELINYKYELASVSDMNALREANAKQAAEAAKQEG